MAWGHFLITRSMVFGTAVYFIVFTRLVLLGVSGFSLTNIF
jgi:hypothetical protein